MECAGGLARQNPVAIVTGGVWRTRFRFRFAPSWFRVRFAARRNPEGVAQQEAVFWGTSCAVEQLRFALKPLVATVRGGLERRSCVSRGDVCASSAGERRGCGLVFCRRGVVQFCIHVFRKTPCNNTCRREETELTDFRADGENLNLCFWVWHSVQTGRV